MTSHSDIIVIGAGIAGATAGAYMADTGKVTILEMEDTAGYHTTGRSAATIVPSYGPPIIRAMTAASQSFFRNPPSGFCEHPLVAARGELMLARAGDEGHIEQARRDGLQDISLAEAKNRIAPLRTDRFIAALYDASAEDLDVDAIHQGFLRMFRAAGGSLVLGAPALGITRKNDIWHIETPKGTFSAAVVVNAAGAWADEVAKAAGTSSLGMQPKRRSAALLPLPADWDVSRWPLVFGAGETFYFRPMAGKLMVSPADATPVDPHDAWGDDMLIAEAIEHLQNAIELEVTRLDHTWGGLRTFAPDGDPVVGFDPLADGFFWLAGQGGYGIQTSPAMARTAASLVAGKPLPADIAAAGVTAQAISPGRLQSQSC